VHSVSGGQGFLTCIQGGLQPFQERWKTLPEDKQPELVMFFVISITAIFQEEPEIRQPEMLSFVSRCKTKHEL